MTSTPPPFLCDESQCWEADPVAQLYSGASEPAAPSWMEIIVGGMTTVVDRAWDGVETVTGIVADVPKSIAGTVADVPKAVSQDASTASMVIADRTAEAAENVAREGGDTAFWGGLGLSAGAVGGAAVLGLGLTALALGADAWFTGGRIVIRPILSRVGA